MTNGSPISRLLAGRLDALGKDGSWFRAALAELGEDLTSETIRCWLNGSYAPRSDKYSTIARVLGIDAASLALAAAGLVVAPAPVAEAS